MKICTKCGNTANDYDNVCPRCGNPFGPPQYNGYNNAAPPPPPPPPQPTIKYNGFNNAAPPPPPQYNSYNNAAPPPPPQPQPNYSVPPTPTPGAYNQNNTGGFSSQPLPMNWFNFLIYFSLFAGSVLNLISGILYISGGIYEMQNASASFIWRTFDGLQALDTLYGLLSIALAAFGIYTRFRLAGFKKDGPKCLYALYGISLAIGVIYIIVLSGIIGTFASDNIFTSFAFPIIMLCANITYFNKRLHLFNK